MTETTLPSAASAKRPDLAALGKIKTRRRGPGWLWLLLIAAAVAAGGWYFSSGTAAPVRYDTASVEKGALMVTVVATGTVQPTTQVDISSELSGTLLSVDVDFNDEVTEGQVLARLDDTKLKAQGTATVKMKDYGFFLPVAAKGKTVVIDGEVKIKTTSVAELKHYAEDAKNSKEEIDAITKPEKAVSVLAKGIVIVE